MVFAAQKLRMIPELKNPTVVIVDDRISLETQITGDFTAADIPNLDSAGTKEELIKFFKADIRKILITTIFRFGDVTETLNTRDNIIVMVDEAHRTQEGDLGEKMRLALPNAFFFGLTGTPINRLDKNTFRLTTLQKLRVVIPIPAVSTDPGQLRHKYLPQRSLRRDREGGNRAVLPRTHQNNAMGSGSPGNDFLCTRQ